MNALQTYPKETATHLALSALASVQAKEPDAIITVEKLTEEAHTIIGPFEPQPEVKEALHNALGEV